MNILGLAQPVTAILSLFVIVRVEVNVVQNDDVGSGQVDAKTPGSRRQQEDEQVRVVVVVVNQLQSVNNNNIHLTQFNPI